MRVLNMALHGLIGFTFLGRRGYSVLGFVSIWSMVRCYDSFGSDFAGD